MRRLFSRAWKWVKLKYAQLRIAYLKWKWQRKYKEDISTYQPEDEKVTPNQDGNPILGVEDMTEEQILQVLMEMFPSKE